MLPSTTAAGPDAVEILSALARLRAEGAGDAALDAFAAIVTGWGRWARVAVLHVGRTGVLGVGASGYDPVEAEVIRQEYARLFHQRSRIPDDARRLDVAVEAYVLPTPSAPPSGGAASMERGDRVLVIAPELDGGPGLAVILSHPSDPARALDDDGLAHLRLISAFADAVGAVRRAVPCSDLEANEEAAEVLTLVEDLNAIDDLQALLDRLTEAACRVSGWRVGVLSVYLPEGALLGGYNLPAEERARFLESMSKTPAERRAAKRAQIRSYAFPGTGICFLPADSPVSKGAAFTPSRPPMAGDWHPDDRLFLLVRMATRREIGVLSLDEPIDGNRPRADRLGPLRLAQRILDLGASLLSNRVLARDLRRGEEAYRMLVEGAPVGIYRRTEAGRMLSANARLVEIFGYPSAEALLADADFLGHIDADASTDARQLSDSGEVRATDMRARKLDGTQIRVRRTLRRDRDGTVLGILEDVTQARRLEENLQRAHRLEALGTLASGVAHDFNNLLAGILGYAALLGPRLEDQPDLAVMAKGIEDAAMRAADLTRQLLGIARPTGAGASPTDVNAVVSECARIAKETFDRRIDVQVRAGAGPLLAVIDAGELHRVVLNLCINARDAMPEGGHLTLVASPDDAGPAAPPSPADRPSGWVRIEVRDTGVGMDEAVRARLFEPFFSTKPRGKGTGLGLYTVYQVLGAYDGAIEVDSRIGAGTTFRLFLPRAAEGAVVPIAGGPHAPATPEPTGLRGRVLVVEDEDAVRNVAAEVLRRRGHQVSLAADGEAAVALVERDPSSIDVVVLDLVLPRLSGIEVFRRCRRLRPDLPVILSSGNVYEGLDAPDVRAGIAGVLPKPYRPDELTSLVERVLAARPGHGLGGRRRT